MCIFYARRNSLKNRMRCAASLKRTRHRDRHNASYQPNVYPPILNADVQV